MRHLLFAPLLCVAPLAALAATSVTVGPSYWDLYRGNKRLAPNIPSLSECAATAGRQGINATYSCISNTSVVVKIVAAQIPPKPPNEVQTVACPDGSVPGSTWTQVREYQAVPAPTYWLAGPWLPAAPPASACPAQPTLPQMPGNPVDLSTVPVWNNGVNDERISNPGQFPNPSDEGGFRTVCAPSHTNNDDPLIYPGQQGASHHHTYFGNGGANYASTVDSIANSGSSTCRGGIANRTSYWAPSMVNGTTYVPPHAMIVYYKNSARFEQSFHREYFEFPHGLRMIAGNPRAMTEAERGPGVFTCIDSSGSGPQTPHIPACAAGNVIWQAVEFPNCWDGANLDSPDHRSHMAYPYQLQQAPWTWYCPATHPVILPLITTNVLYVVPAGADTTKWKLTSDMAATGPWGYSNHSDWWNGWKSDINRTWVAGCNNAQKDCQAHMLGDGRVLDSFGGNREVDLYKHAPKIPGRLGITPPRPQAAKGK